MDRQVRRRAGALAGWTALALTLGTAQTAEARSRRAPKVETAEAGPAKAKVVTAPEARSAPRRSGAPLFAVVLGPGPAWKRGQPLRRGASDSHYRYWQDLHRQGRVESAGPVGKDTGFALLHARSQREANAVLAADPAVRSGQFRAVARPYDPAFADAD